MSPCLQEVNSVTLSDKKERVKKKIGRGTCCFIEIALNYARFPVSV